MIWVGTDDGKVQVTEIRRQLDGRDAGARRGRRAGRIGRSRACSRRRTTPPRRSCRRAVSDTTTSSRSSSRPPTPASRGRHHRQSSQRADQRRRPGSQEPEPAHRRHRHGGSCLDRRRREWSRLKANLPTVAVHDLTIHPRENDLVLGTYGRAIWVGDITPLQDLVGRDARQERPSLRHRAAGAVRLRRDRQLLPVRYGTLDAPNEPEAIVINYYVKADVEAGARITVTDERPRGRDVDGPGATRAESRAVAAWRRWWPRRRAPRRRAAAGRRLHGHARSRRREDDQAGEDSRAALGDGPVFHSFGTKRDRPHTAARPSPKGPKL